MKEVSDNDLDREIRAHLALETEERIENGVTADEARYAALRAFGNVTRVKEVCYEMRRLTALDHIVQDLRFALRQLQKAPTFAIAAILTLAIGLGVNTSAFTLIYALALRPLPVKDPDRVVSVFQTFYGQFNRQVSGNIHQLSYPEYLEYRDRNQSFQALAAFAEADVSLAGGHTEAGHALLASCNYFDALGVTITLGRALLADECKTPGTAPVAVLSHGFWQRRFGADPAIIGKNIVLNQHALTIIGVAERAFGGTGLRVPDLWVPITMQPMLRPNLPESLQANSSWLNVIGRLKPRLSAAQARADLSRIAQQIDAKYPGRQTVVSVDQGAHLNGPEVRRKGLPLAAAVLGLVGLVLLMACCNVMNLLLARAAARQQEFGLRLAMGAGRARLVQQLLTEGCVIALLGGAVGLLLASWLPQILLAAVSDGGLQLNLKPDLRVFGYGVALSGVSVVVFGLVPALSSTQVDLLSLIKDEATVLGKQIRGSKLRRHLITAQVAGTLLLLVMAALLIRGVWHAQRVDPGFATHDVLSISIDLPQQGYSAQRARAFYRDVGARLRALPGVEAVSVAASLPLAGRHLTSVALEPTSSPAADMLPVHFNVVSAEYFRTLGIKLIEGRSFSADESVSVAPTPAVVSASMARSFWGPGQAVGARFRSTKTTYQVVGVAEDVRNLDLSQRDGPFFYAAASPDELSGAKVLVRASGRTATVAAVVPGVIRGLDGNLLIRVERLEDHIAQLLQPSRAAALLSVLLGLFGVLLASIGVYGVVNYSVSLRKREIGIRMALGALPRDIVTLVVQQGAMPVIIGFIIGGLLAAAASRVISGMLFGLSPLDPMSYTAAAAFLCAAAMLAMYAPTRRAVRLEPTETLRLR